MPTGYCVKQEQRKEPNYSIYFFYNLIIRKTTLRHMYVAGGITGNQNTKLL